ncbi:hypothetical protein [Salinirarus marinus]|uniref:hypothetical protein n=1 Tax=Salinirarus marinus TaxID=3068310 RepID=UPI003C6C3410
MSNEPPARRRPTPREQTWLDAVDDVLDAIIDREEDLECSFEELTVDVPIRMGPESDVARWRVDGTLRVSVDGADGPLAEWLRWWSRQLA